MQNFQMESSYQSASSTSFKILDQEPCSVLQESKNCIALNLNALFINKKIFNEIDEYGSLSGLTYCWLWNSTSTLIQAAKLVQ